MDNQQGIMWRDKKHRAEAGGYTPGYRARTIAPIITGDVRAAFHWRCVLPRSDYDNNKMLIIRATAVMMRVLFLGRGGHANLCVINIPAHEGK